MNKKKLKQEKAKEQTIKELVLLLPAFQYMYRRLEDATSESDRQTKDYEIARLITRAMARRIVAYKSLQHEAIKRWNVIEKEKGDDDYNVFLLGMSLLSSHMEVKQKKISIGLDSEIMQLQDLCYEFFDAKQINRTIQ